MNGDPRRILVLEDDPFHYEMLRDACEGRVELQRVTQLSDALSASRRERFEVLLLDLHVPDSSGIATLQKALQECLDLPVVVLTTVDDLELGAQCVRLGAHDYLVKGRDPTLGDLVLRAIRHAVERQAAHVELEEERKRRDAMKDEFLSHVSHELRTPLSAVQQFANILLAGIPGALTDMQREYLEIVVRNAKQLAKMIEDILEVARAQTEKLRIQLRPVAVGPIVAEVLERLGPGAVAKEVELGSTLPDDLDRMYADPDRIAQVLSNLVENAIKFTPRAGRIRVSAKRREGAICFEVADSGCGVSEANRDRIFERMLQDPNGLEHSRKGLGLGLFICRELVTRHAGRIWLERSDASGSVFCFTIPRYDLPCLLRARIVADGKLRRDVTLVSFDLDLRAARCEGMLADRALDVLRDLVERSVYADRDLVLPHPVAIGSTEGMVVVASTDRTGAESLCSRVRTAVGMSDELGDLEGLLRISHAQLDMSALSALRLDDAIAEIGRRIEALGCAG